MKAATKSRILNITMEILAGIVFWHSIWYPQVVTFMLYVTFGLGMATSGVYFAQKTDSSLTTTHYITYILGAHAPLWIDLVFYLFIFTVMGITQQWITFLWWWYICYMDINDRYEAAKFWKKVPEDLKKLVLEIGTIDNLPKV